MPIQVRLQYPGALDPVMARGDRRDAIFCDDEDRRMFLEALGEACGRTGWKCHASAEILTAPPLAPLRGFYLLRN